MVRIPFLSLSRVLKLELFVIKNTVIMHVFLTYPAVAPDYVQCPNSNTMSFWALLNSRVCVHDVSFV